MSEISPILVLQT